MENNIYLDKVIEFLVRDTIIDYDKQKIKFPFPFYYFSSFRLPFFSLYFSPSRMSSSQFSDYCRDIYGLTDEEIKYVWNEYKKVITDKINER